LQPAPTTQGVFILIISALLLVSVPHIAQMIKENKIIGGINNG
jgi:competence protein ComGC